MSDFSDFMTMKIIEQRRLENNRPNNDAQDYFAEHFNLNRNLNVRTRVDLISRIEVMANFFGVTKAKLVTEILESSMNEAFEMIEKEGWQDTYLKAHYKNMETQYGIKGKDFDEKGLPTKFIFPEELNKSDD